MHVGTVPEKYRMISHMGFVLCCCKDLSYTVIYIYITYIMQAPAHTVLINLPFNNLLWNNPIEQLAPQKLTNPKDQNALIKRDDRTR